MSRIILISLFFSLFSIASFAQSKAAYLIFNKKGKKISYKKFLKKVADADVLLFGELHNNALIHWLQLELASDLYAKKGVNFLLGAEMMEADQQTLLDDYLTGTITEETFETEANLWSNHKSDYRALVRLAKEHQCPFIASNIPRPYASLVFREGIEQLETLSAEQKQHIAPLPIPIDLTLPGYVQMMEMMGDHSKEGENFPKAQAVKDATMGYFITNAMQENSYFYHINGSYHSDNFEGIGWYIRRYRPQTKVKTISTVEQKNIRKLEKESIGIADFIICIPETMTKTY